MEVNRTNRKEIEKQDNTSSIYSSSIYFGASVHLFHRAFNVARGVFRVNAVRLVSTGGRRPVSISLFYRRAAELCGHDE